MTLNTVIAYNVCNNEVRSKVMKKHTIKTPSKWIGKKVDTNKWSIPQGYHLCAKTGKLFAEDDLLVTFAHWLFDRSWLVAKGIMVEDADWLSEEGFFEIADVLKREEKWHYYLERDAA